MIRFPLRPVFLLIGLTFIPACGPTCEIPADARPFELGTGEACFERVENDESVPLLAGPQGGYHVWLALGCADCTNPVWLRFTVNDATTGAEIQPMTENIVDLVGDEWPQAAGVQVSMPDPPPAQGTKLSIAVEAWDAGGQSLLHEGVLRVTVGPTELWEP